MVDPRFPALLFGKITSITRPVVDRLVYVKDVDLGETQTILTDEFGQWVIDAANYESEYSIGDTIEVSLDDDFPSHSENITVENGRIELTL